MLSIFHSDQCFERRRTSMIVATGFLSQNGYGTGKSFLLKISYTILKSFSKITFITVPTTMALLCTSVANTVTLLCVATLLTTVGLIMGVSISVSDHRGGTFRFP